VMTPLTLCNYLDLPAVSVPAWRHRDPATGMVPGVMLACAPGAEGLLLDVALVLESSIGRPPAVFGGANTGSHASDGIRSNAADPQQVTSYGD